MGSLREIRVSASHLFHNLSQPAVGDFLAAVGVLHGEIKGLRVDGCYVHAPAFGRVGFGLLQFGELSEVLGGKKAFIASLPVSDPKHRLGQPAAEGVVVLKLMAIIAFFSAW